MATETHPDREPPIPNFDAWHEANDHALWAQYHEAGADYDTDYALWLERRYTLLLARQARRAARPADLGMQRDDLSGRGGSNPPRVRGDEPDRTLAKARLAIRVTG